MGFQSTGQNPPIYLFVKHLPLLNGLLSVLLVPATWVTRLLHANNAGKHFMNRPNFILKSGS